MAGLFPWRCFSPAGLSSPVLVTTVISCLEFVRRISDVAVLTGALASHWSTVKLCSGPPQCRTTYSAVAYSHSICDVVSIRPVCLSFFLTAACLASIPVCTAPRSVSKTSNSSLLIFYLSKTYRQLQLIYTVLFLSRLPLPNANGWDSDRSAPSAIFTSWVTPRRRKPNITIFSISGLS